MPVPKDTTISEVAIDLVVEQVSALVHGLDPSATVDVEGGSSNPSIVRSALCHAVNEVPQLSHENLNMASSAQATVMALCVWLFPPSFGNVRFLWIRGIEARFSISVAKLGALVAESAPLGCRSQPHLGVSYGSKSASLMLFFVKMKSFEDSVLALLGSGSLVQMIWRKVLLFPKGLPYLRGSHLSIFLALADFAPDSKVYADYTFCIVDQLQAKHITFEGKRIVMNLKVIRYRHVDV
ncbi:hypothetical protein JRO89_XS11G0089600 [Xanthoceras sorbifolium]|uniref:Uncharacterized protein n=1 Tax=Xanthoceras sorbifolium TaxID=99658 RepID=A0ABQ8HF53_9ROSI|nr:hypothetical protein JRO89_XS11G0089600 [Xanthoceras sorbifolium]